jgi:hypothetical protein
VGFPEGTSVAVADIVVAISVPLVAVTGVVVRLGSGVKEGPLLTSGVDDGSITAVGLSMGGAVVGEA